MPELLYQYVANRKHLKESDLSISSDAIGLLSDYQYLCMYVICISCVYGSIGEEILPSAAEILCTVYVWI